jgi:hypothetical protein
LVPSLLLWLQFLMVKFQLENPTSLNEKPRHLGPCGHSRHSHSRACGHGTASGPYPGRHRPKLPGSLQNIGWFGSMNWKWCKNPWICLRGAQKIKHIHYRFPKWWIFHWENKKSP